MEPHWTRVGRDLGIWHAEGGLAFFLTLFSPPLPAAEAFKSSALTSGVPLMAVSTATSSRRAEFAACAHPRPPSFIGA
jgi:hypothetical protein